MISNENIKDLQARVQTLGRCLNIEERRADVAARQEKTLAADFWDDPKEAEKFLKELSGVKFWVTGFDSVSSGAEDLNVLYDFAKESLSGAGDDAQTPEAEELEQAYASVLEELEALELRNMLGEEGDNLGAVLTINSGAGGTGYCGGSRRKGSRSRWCIQPSYPPDAEGCGDAFRSGLSADAHEGSLPARSVCLQGNADAGGPFHACH